MIPSRVAFGATGRSLGLLGLVGVGQFLVEVGEVRQVGRPSRSWCTRRSEDGTLEPAGRARAGADRHEHGDRLRLQATVPLSVRFSMEALDAGRRIGL